MVDFQINKHIKLLHVEGVSRLPDLVAFDADVSVVGDGVSADGEDDDFRAGEAKVREAVASVAP